MATYRIVERRSWTEGSLSSSPEEKIHYYVQRRWWKFGWFDQCYAEASGGQSELGITRKYWFNTFEEARAHILGGNPFATVETIIVQYLNV